jgi:hypothetical protein
VLRLLTREYASFMRKSNALCCLAATLLESIFRDVEEWPLEFLQVYAQDAVDARFWVDAEACRPLCDGVLTAFTVSAAQQQSSSSSSSMGGSAARSPVAGMRGQFSEDTEVRLFCIAP